MRKSKNKRFEESIQRGKYMKEIFRSMRSKSNNWSCDEEKSQFIGR
jgi:hypothetical protein